MPDTDQKAEGQLLENPPSPEQLQYLLDNPSTETLKPVVAEVKVYSNAKTNIIIPERVVLALGGNSAFNESVTGLDTIKYISGRALDKTETDSGAAVIDPQTPGSDWISTAIKSQTRGRPFKIPVKPYDWGRTIKFDSVTFRAPSWITILAIRWMFWNWLVDPEKSIPGGGIYTRGRFYPLREIKDTEFKTADLND